MQGVRMGSRARSGDPIASPVHDPSPDLWWNQATAEN